MSKIKAKFNSYSRRKKVGVSCCSFCCILMITGIVIAMIAVPYMLNTVNSEIINDIETINPGGIKGKAFVVYRPGVSSFQRDVTYAFIEGLEESGWSIQVTTASSQTPTSLSQYDILVLGTPTYGGKPHQSVLDYLNRIGNLKHKKVVLIVTAGGSNAVPEIMKNAVEQVNGVVIESLLYYNMVPNPGVPTDLSREAGRNLQI